MNGFKRACALAFVGALAFAAPAAAADPAQVGSWSSLQNYPIVPVSMGVTPDGKIVAWDQANKAPYFGSVPHNGGAMVLDPATGTITRSINLAPNSLFCSLITSLPDGRLAIIGGGSGSGAATAKVQVYDGESQTFSVAGEMERTRWYPGGDIDSRGNVLVAGGTSKGIEKVDATTGQGTLVDATFPSNWYPDLIRMPDGRFAIEDVGDLVAGSGSGAGRYLLGTSLSPITNTTLLQERLRGVRTMISPYRFFYNSGGTQKSSMVIDVSSGTPQYTSAAPSRFPHMTGQAVTLPTGEVLAVGGNSSGHATNGTPVFTPELYRPSANTWTSMADTARQRQYHSVAALLPDGRVWSAGTSFDAAQEPNGQFFSPPYLFKRDGSGQLAPRPTATDAPSAVKWGESFSVATGDPANIASASLVRLAATTHQLNAGQAYVPLSVTPNGGRVQMTTPAGNVIPAGYYMLFLVDRNGVPSVAPIMRVKPDDETAIPPRVTQSSQLDRAWGASEAFDGVTANAAGATGSVAQTAVENQPWWGVDLGSSRDLESVTLNLRTDAQTARDLWVFASDTPFRSVTVDGLRAQAGVTAVRVQTPSGSVGTATLQRTARYIRVQSPGTGVALNLAEVTPNPRVSTPPPLTTPNLAASAASASAINLSWADQANESGYTLQRSTSSSFSSPTTVELGANATSYASTGLAASTTYYYRLRAKGTGTTVSAWSATASAKTAAAATVPNRPTSLSATARSSSRIDLTWRDNATNETGYTLQRSTSSSFSSPTTVELPANARSYSSTGLASRTTYYYRVRAKTSTATSAWSVADSARTRWR